MPREGGGAWDDDAVSEEEEIAAWLRGQAEADISRAELAGGGEWRTGCECEDDCPGCPSCERVEGAGITVYAEGGHDADQALHIAAHDPRTEAARAESVLAVIGEYEAAAVKARAMDVPSGRKWAPPHVNACTRALARAVRLLAYGYRHRGGYKEEAWKP